MPYSIICENHVKIPEHNIFANARIYLVFLILAFYTLSIISFRLSPSLCSHCFDYAFKFLHAC